MRPGRRYGRTYVVMLRIAGAVDRAGPRRAGVGPRPACRLRGATPRPLRPRRVLSSLLKPANRFCTLATMFQACTCTGRNGQVSEALFQKGRSGSQRRSVRGITRKLLEKHGQARVDRLQLRRHLGSRQRERTVLQQDGPGDVTGREQQFFRRRIEVIEVEERSRHSDAFPGVIDLRPPIRPVRVREFGGGKPRPPVVRVAQREPQAQRPARIIVPVRQTPQEPRTAVLLEVDVARTPEPDSLAIGMENEHVDVAARAHGASRRGPHQYHGCRLGQPGLRESVHHGVHSRPEPGCFSHLVPRARRSRRRSRP